MDSIRVMVSSRVGAPLSRGHGAPTIGEAAAQVKTELGKQLLFPGAEFEQDPLFDFDLSLEDSERPADKPIEQQCQEMVADADIILALYNGDAGSQLQGNADGICFLEMRAAMDFAPEKLVVVSLPPKPRPTAADKRFREWFDDQQVWTAPRAAGTLDAVVEASRHALRVAVAKMVQRAGHVRLGGFHLGGALEWSRMSYQDRAAAMRHAVYKSLRPHGRELKGPGEGETTLFALGRGKQQVFTWIHAIPAAISEPHAREMVGQPHLNDHNLNDRLGDMPGPLHVVACARGVTEAQAVRILGFPDAIIIKAPFGVFVADEVQKIQMAFLAQCRDEPTTREAVTRFVGWLDQTGERDSIIARGELRSKLVTVLAEKVR